MTNTTTTTETRIDFQNRMDAKAKAVIEAGGYRPLYVCIGRAVVAEWATETEARTYAAEMSKHAECSVTWDADCGWSTTMDLEALSA